MILAPVSVLVTGSSGFIGSHLVRHLRTAGQQVTGIDSRRPASPLPDDDEARNFRRMIGM